MDLPERDVRAAVHGPGGHGNIKISLYAVAAALSLVVFVMPLVWALMRSLQPNDTITAVPGRSLRMVAGLASRVSTLDATRRHCAAAYSASCPAATEIGDTGCVRA